MVWGQKVEEEHWGPGRGIGSWIGLMGPKLMRKPGNGK